MTAATMSMRPYPPNTTYSNWAPQHHQMISSHQQQQHQQHQSQMPVPTPMDQEGLVATGKKRKRLQRACVACHKAKRRCDGGLPCSNCDFSGRTCSYSDSQGKTVAPTKRSLKPSEAAKQEQQIHQQYPISNQPMPMMQPYQQSAIMHQSPAMNPHGSPSTGVSYSLSPSADHNISPRQHANGLPRIEPSLETRRELLLIFFSHLQPLSSIMDEISFLRDLSSNEVPYVLLYAMYAVSAEYAFDVHLQQSSHSPLTSSGPSSGNGSINKYSRISSEAGNGSRYASEARKLLYMEDERSSLSMIDGSARIEVAQALCLLAFFEFGQKRYFRASSYIQLSSKHVSALSSSQVLLTRDGSSGSADGGALLSRNTKRLACLLTAMDASMSMMSGQSMATRPIDIDSIVESPRSGSPRLEDDQETSALMHLRTVSLILNSALEVRQRSRNAISKTVDEAMIRCEQDLHRWADDLPRRLQYDQGRLQSVSHLLNSSRASSPSSSLAPMTRSAAVCWSMMHMVAETTTLVLKDASANRSDRSKESGYLAACNNISILLEQSNPAALPKLFAGLGVSVLYSVSSTISKGSDDREWLRVADIARSFASYAQLGDSVWNSMTSWWSFSNHHMRNASDTIRLSHPSPPSKTQIYRRPISTSPKLPATSNNRSTSISQHRAGPLTSPPSNYHYLPSLNNLTTTLPPLRMPSSSDHLHKKRSSWELQQQQQQPSYPNLAVDL